MIAVVRCLDPLLGVLPRQRLVLAGQRLLAAHFTQAGKRAQAANGFGAEVDVVGEVPRKIVGAELVLGIETLLLQVRGPPLELLPVQAGEVGMPLHVRDGGQENQQIPALFDRHLVLFRTLPAPIDLAVGVRILAEIVGSERECPALGRRIVHEWHEKGLGQRRAEQQELGRHRIKHVGRADTAVRVVLLAELQGLSVIVGHELTRRKTLAESQGCE